MHILHILLDSSSLDRYTPGRQSDLRIGVNRVNTMLAGAFGGMTLGVDDHFVGGGAGSLIGAEPHERQEGRGLNLRKPT